MQQVLEDIRADHDVDRPEVIERFRLKIATDEFDPVFLEFTGVQIVAVEGYPSLVAKLRKEVRGAGAEVEDGIAEQVGMRVQ